MEESRSSARSRVSVEHTGARSREEELVLRARHADEEEAALLGDLFRFPLELAALGYVERAQVGE